MRALYVEGEEKYIVNFGHSGPGGGSGRLYTIYIDDEDNVEMEEDALIGICHWDN